MDIFQWMSGNITLRITAADPTQMLVNLNSNGIIIYDIRHQDAFTVTACIPRSALKDAMRLIQKRGGDATVCRRDGLYWLVKDFVGRPVLLMAICIVVFLSLYLPTRILFVRVAGNENISTQTIIETAESYGLRFMSARQKIRSEKFKNQLLAALPQLEWAGINTAGCTATITVRERADTQTKEHASGVSSIVAVRDGVISQITVTQGNALCRVGQAVKAGQTLVSGYTDCGIHIKATRSEGEIYAITHRTVDIVGIDKALEKSAMVKKQSFYFLCVGERCIPLNTTDIPLDNQNTYWRKEQKVYSLTLPGGWELPVSLIEWEYTSYETTVVANADAGKSLLSFAKDYAVSQMVSGRVISAVTSDFEVSSVGVQRVELSCVEMIGKLRWEDAGEIP